MKRLTKKTFEKVYISLAGEEGFKKAIPVILAGRASQLRWFEEVVTILKKERYNVSSRKLISRVKAWYSNGGEK